jgi:hypothetical protein
LGQGQEHWSRAGALPVIIVGAGLGESRIVRYRNFRRQKQEQERELQEMQEPGQEQWQWHEEQ